MRRLAAVVAAAVQVEMLLLDMPLVEEEGVVLLNILPVQAGMRA